MVTESPDKVEAEVQTEAPPETQPDAVVSSDADLSPSTDAATSTDTPAVEEVTLPDNADDYVKQMLDKESAAQEPEAKTQARPAVDPAVVQQARAAYESDTKKRHERLDEHATRLRDAGYDQIQIDAILKTSHDALNEQHADALSRGHYEAAAQSFNDTANQILMATHAVLPQGKGPAYNQALNDIAEASEGKQATISDAIRLAVEMARDGAVEEYKKTRLAVLIDEAWNAGRRAGEGAGRAGSSGQNVNGTAPRTGQLDPDNINDANKMLADAGV